MARNNNFFRGLAQFYFLFASFIFVNRGKIGSNVERDFLVIWLGEKRSSISTNYPQDDPAELPIGIIDPYGTTISHWLIANDVIQSNRQQLSSKIIDPCNFFFLKI